MRGAKQRIMASVGDWVVAGNGEDADMGRILDLCQDTAQVGWITGVSTEMQLKSGVNVYDNREAAEADLTERLAR